MNADENAVASILKDYENALNSSDTEAALRLYAPDGVFMPQHSRSGVGTAALRQAYLRMVGSPDYLEEATKRGLDVGQPNTGEELTDFVATKLTAFPAETIAEYRTYVQHP